jgi:hypothetical protein
MEYQNRAWITRPRPGIDRVSSAWLIKRFIDSKASFLFDSSPKVHPDGVPFDMSYNSPFSPMEKITEGAMKIPPALGVATAINFQPTGPGKAAISGNLFCSPAR